MEISRFLIELNLIFGFKAQTSAIISEYYMLITRVEWLIKDSALWPSSNADFFTTANLSVQELIEVPGHVIQATDLSAAETGGKVLIEDI